MGSNYLDGLTVSCGKGFELGGPNQSARQVKKRQIVACRFFVTRGNAAKTLEGMKETLDAVAQAVQFLVEWQWLLAGRVAENDRDQALGFDRLNDLVGVVTSVGDERLPPPIIQKTFRHGDIMLLPRGNFDMQRSALRVRDCVDFRGHTAAGAPKGVVFGSPDSAA